MCKITLPLTTCTLQPAFGMKLKLQKNCRTKWIDGIEGWIYQLRRGSFSDSVLLVCKL